MRTTTYLIIFSLLGIFISQSPCHGQTTSSSPQSIKELQKAIENVLEETNTPAAGIALVNEDGPVWVTGLGKADIETNTPTNENTMFRIGSVSKMLVSLAILKLQEEGRVSLKDKVRDLAPEIEFKNPWKDTSPILVEHLLEHTTGWDDMHLAEYACNDPKPLTLKEGLDYHPHSRISRWVPGTRMSYSNSGPPVAAYIIEKVTGKTFEKYIEENFFQPLGMETATYFLSESYEKFGASLYSNGEPQDYWHILLRPSGAINASARDMAKLVEFFINRGQVDSINLISEASLTRMETPQSSNGVKAGLENGYGLSNISSPYGNFVYRSHSGGMSGGLAELSYLPEHNVGYAFMINSDNNVAKNRINNLIRAFQTKDLLGKYTGNRSSENPDEDITGYYVPINPRINLVYFLQRILNVEHIWQKDKFIFRNGVLGGHVKKYIPKNNNRYASVETGRIHMVQTKDPLAGNVVHAGMTVLKRVSPLLVFGQLSLGILWILMMTSSVILGIIWIIRYRIGKIAGGPNIWIHIWPLITSVLFIMITIAFILGSKDIIALLGNVTLVSVSIMIFTILFGISSLWSAIYVFKNQSLKSNSFSFWHSLVISILHLVVTCYLAWFGIIGIQTWS